MFKRTHWLVESTELLLVSSLWLISPYSRLHTLPLVAQFWTGELYNLFFVRIVCLAVGSPSDCFCLVASAAPPNIVCSATYCVRFCTTGSATQNRNCSLSTMHSKAFRDHQIIVCLVRCHHRLLLRGVLCLSHTKLSQLNNRICRSPQIQMSGNIYVISVCVEIVGCG